MRPADQRIHRDTHHLWKDLMNHTGTVRGVTVTALATLAVTAVPLGGAHAAASAVTRTLVATSADSAAFDLDEYDPTDVTVQVTGKKPVDVDDTQDVQYHWLVTPFDTAQPPVRLPATGEDVVTDDVVGQFVVPFPAGQPSGAYTLVAGLGPDADGRGTIKRHSLLTVQAGQAALTVASDTDPVRTAAGGELPLTGRLALEDGTALPGRMIDLTFAPGSVGSDPGPDAGILVDPATAPVPAASVVTGRKGGFATVVDDPAEAGQGTELGGVLSAATGATPDIGNAGAGDDLGVDFISEVPNAGSSITMTDLGDGKPGEALAGQVKVTAPDDTFDTDPHTPEVQGDADTDPDPVRDQVVALTLDHGFFTTGDEEAGTGEGQQVGNLEEIGTTITGLTAPDGTLDYQVGIKRDVDFDDDALVTATASGDAGGLLGDSTAEWDADEPFNGQVEIALSPEDEQVAPVDPTLAANRTYYEVYSQDQFGNHVAEIPIDLMYSGNLDDWDYSDDFVDTDFDTNGDIWLVSYESGAITVKGRWNSAPTYVYDQNGDPVAGHADTVGSATANFYEIDFDASKFTLKPSIKGTVGVGSLITETVRVVDQVGNPVRGYRVKFFRYGPDIAAGDPVASRATNALGKAEYSFIAPQRGKANITAVIREPNGVFTRTLEDVVVIGYPVTAKLQAHKSDRKHDELTVSAEKRASAARVVLYRVTNGVRKAVASHALGKTGQVDFTVRDRNGRQATTYVALVKSTRTTGSDETGTVRTR